MDQEPQTQLLAGSRRMQRASGNGIGLANLFNYLSTYTNEFVRFPFSYMSLVNTSGIRTKCHNICW